MDEIEPTLVWGLALNAADLAYLLGHTGVCQVRISISDEAKRRGVVGQQRLTVCGAGNGNDEPREAWIEGWIEVPGGRVCVHVAGWDPRTGEGRVVFPPGDIFDAHEVAQAEQREKAKATGSPSEGARATAITDELDLSNREVANIRRLVFPGPSRILMELSGVLAPGNREDRDFFAVTEYGYTGLNYGTDYVGGCLYRGPHPGQTPLRIVILSPTGIPEIWGTETYHELLPFYYGWPWK